MILLKRYGDVKIKDGGGNDMYTVEESLRYLHDNNVEILIEQERFVTFKLSDEEIYYDTEFDTLEVGCTSISLDLIFHSSNIMFNVVPIVNGEMAGSEEICRKLEDVCEAIFPGWAKTKDIIDVSFDESDD